MMSHRADPLARPIADRHYNRQKVGSPQFVPPGRCLVLRTDVALWSTSWPFPQYVKHRWPGAWVCSLFRNEGADLSSELIAEAVMATRWRYNKDCEGHDPAEGMITFVDPGKTRRKRDPGRCFRRAGFEEVGLTKGGLVALQLPPARLCYFPPMAPLEGAPDSTRRLRTPDRQLDLWIVAPSGGAEGGLRP